MALIRDISVAQITLQVAGGTPDQFQVMRYRGTEGLCQLYRFEIELATTADSLPFADVVGKTAVLSINTDYGERWFHGIVSRFEFTGETAGQTYYRAELVPAVWLLTHRYSSRIFQDMKVPDILSNVLTTAGIASDRFDLSGLSRAYEPREYCVQYRETDYNFLCRLMEEEGIRWYFEQTKESHKLILEDSSGGSYQPIEEEAELKYRPPAEMLPAAEHVFRFRMGQSVRPGAVVLRDYNFKKPKLDLQTTADCGRDAALEFSDFPGEYSEQAPGQDLAKLRAEEFEAHRTVGVGQSNSPRLTPGRTFDLSGHPNGLDGSYLLTTITHQGKQTVRRTAADTNGQSGVLDPRLYRSIVAARGSDEPHVRELAEALLQIVGRIRGHDPTAHRALTEWVFHSGQVARDEPTVAGASGARPMEAVAIANLIEDVVAGSIVDYDAPIYECRFECIPAAVSFRPPRVTPWPVMRGAQNARVVGPEGEEIHTDEYGRVKVQFDWDRVGGHKENASCWIRVCQGFAGGNYGIMFIPRVGQEVIVDFLEGDPDKPVIVGRVYNADHMPPYALPDEKTKSVIKTQSSKDGGGTNEIRFEDLKDKEQLFLQAQRQMDTRVKANHFHTVGGTYDLHIGGEKGGDLKGEYRQLVHEAKHTHVKGELRQWTELDESYKVDGKVSIDVTGTHSTTVQSDVVESLGANHKHEVGQTYACKAVNIKLEATGGIEFKCGGSSIVLTPAAVFIVGGPLVNINSGAGPPVGPVTSTATSPETAEDPAVADQSDPGKDTRYDGGEEIPEAEPQPEVAGQEFEPEEVEEEELSWIEIELVNEDGTPAAGEPFELTLADGKPRKGSLDANGLARIENIKPGTCQLKFTRIDREFWHRI